MTPPAAPNLTEYVGKRPLKYEIQVPGTRAEPEPKTFSYTVQLPPEYNPYRKYPCMVVLPGDKDIERQVLLWCGPYNEKLGIRVGQAMRNGYIVVVVDWKEDSQFEYKYSATEHIQS